MSIFRKSAEAFERAVAPFERQIYFTCLRMMGNRQDAEDCAQEAMLKAYRSFGSFRGEAGLGTWLYAIAARCCMDALRARKADASLDEMREAGWEKEDEAPSPYLRLEAAERRRALERGISGLPEEQRLALVLCDLQGLSYEEAASAMDCPPGTLRSRLHRARQSLKKILSGQGELLDETDRLSDERGKQDDL